MSLNKKQIHINDIWSQFDLDENNEIKKTNIIKNNQTTASK